MTDGQIIKAYEGLTPRQQLNLFRNLYYNDGYATEQGVIANAINDMLPEYERQKAENERKDRILESYALQYGTVTDKEVFLKKARDEAIREYAERLKATPYRFRVEQIIYFDKPPITKMVLFVDDNDIDNLVKVMKEDK